MLPLTVAAVQAESIPADIPANVATAARLAGQAADRGARLAVLPELFLPAYHPPALHDPATDLHAGSDGLIQDARLDPLRAVARDRAVVVVIGAAVRTADARRVCAALVAGTDGTVRSAYEKQILCGDIERDLFAPGSAGATLHVDGWRFGLGICYDGCFPEHARAAQADDVHGMVYPSAYRVGSEHRRDVYYAARALDNTGYVIYANAVDGRDPWLFNGGAAIYDPEGRSVVKGPNTGESVLMTVLSPDEITRTRAAHQMLIDRPETIYAGGDVCRTQVYT
jgi:predicted amidohydrolase